MGRQTLQRLEVAGNLLTCVEKGDSGRCIKYIKTCDGDDCITESPAHPDVPGRKKKKAAKKTTKKPKKAAKAKKPPAPKKPGRASDPTSDEEGAAYLEAERDYMSGLAGDLLTCSRWIVVGKGKDALIRCGSYKRTCPVGEDCAEPKPKTVKTVKTKAEPYGVFWFNVVKGGTKVTPIPAETIGADFEKFLVADGGKSYMVFGHGAKAAEEELTKNLERIREMRKEYGGGFTSDSPTEQTLKLPGQPTFTYYVQPLTDPEAFHALTKGHTVKDMVGNRLMLTRGTVPVRSTVEEPVLPKAEPAEPKVDRWMEDRPFSKDDTNRYNAFTFHPIDDLNDQFTGSIQPKLDEVDRLMKKYEVKEIPEEVQTGLAWYRRRTYEYLQRMIYSRNNAPGSFVVGPSNYNVRKHNKTIAGDEKYREALDVSGRKLDSAISKTITRRKTGKKAVAVSDRDKWEATAVVTKRNKFGNMTEKDFVENLKKKPETELTPNDKMLLDPKSTFRTQIRVEGRNLHARLIQEAFDRGVTISPEVMAEYPDLARPKIDLTTDKYSWSHTPWRKWEERKPPILLNPEHGIPDDRAYIVQDRSQRKSAEQGWDFSVVDALQIEFDGAKSVPMIVHKSTKEPGTYDVSYVPTGSVLAAQYNPLDSKTKAIDRVRDWIAEDPDGFISKIDRPSKERVIADYPHFRDMYKNLNAVKAGKRKWINVHQVKESDLEDLSGIGAVLQAANAVYSLAKIAL